MTDHARPPARRRPVVVSVEQALSLPYATLRFVHQGWRVIRVEQTPVPGRATPGDPNRYIGRPVGGGGDDRHSYYVAPNVGKEAIALNLKTEEGRDLLHRIVRDLEVDVFCVNTIPMRHEPLGIDATTLRGIREDLIWASISAMGTAEPTVPGYDPVMQALCGFMDLTGNADGPPLQCGPPMIDLKAGDELFTQVILAMLDRSHGGGGRTIDVSMAQVAVSWLHTFLPMLDMGSLPEELRRNGNEHRQFIPVNAYPTADGYVFVAIGSDAQWQRFVAHEMFATLDEPRFTTNESRRENKDDLHALIGATTARHSSTAVGTALTEASIPHSEITPINKVADLPFVAAAALKTETPDGQTVRLPPPAVATQFLDECDGRLPFAPSYGENTAAVLAEIGTTEAELEHLRVAGTIAP